MNAIIARATALLQGEPLRFIVYGAAIVVWLVVGIANAIGFSHFGPSISLTDSMTEATIAAAFLTEIGRRYVSPAINVTPKP